MDGLLFLVNAAAVAAAVWYAVKLSKQRIVCRKYFFSEFILACVFLGVIAEFVVLVFDYELIKNILWINSSAVVLFWLMYHRCKNKRRK